MTAIRITGGTIHDPANDIDGEVRDLCLDNGKLVPEVGPDARRIDARGMVVMPGGVDIHAHIAGPKVNAARRLSPDDRRDDPLDRTEVLRSGSGGLVPSTFATGYRYSLLGYTTVVEAAAPPLAARHVLAELRDTPLIDKAFLILMGNNQVLFELIRESGGVSSRLCDAIAWWLEATGGYGVKLVNPGGRLGYNRVNSHRYQFNYNVDVSGQVGFPGVPFTPINGGLPQLTFGDGSAPTLGSPTFLPSVEIQNTYVLSDNVTWVKGKHTLKFGTEIRREEFTIFQPASPRGNEGFGTTLSDNPANPGTGGSGLASFLLGLASGGGINNLHNVDYFRPLYSFYTQDDWKLTPKLTLNLGLRYELFTTVKERHNEQGTFDLRDPNNPTIIVPKGQTMQLTPTLASEITVSPTGSRGLIPVDTNNFAPRVGFAYQLTPGTVLRGGYGIFYGGQENGPYSNPSPGFNPPFFVTQAFNAPCGAASANPALFASGNDCAVPGLSNAPGGIPGSAGISVGFPATSLTDPNTPTLFTVDPGMVTPYMQQWNFGIERQLGKDTVLQVTYAGSKGTKLFTFYNGNQADPSPNPSAPFAPRRPVPLIDTGINYFKSDGGSKYNSLQSRIEKRFTHGFSVLVTYTYSHAQDNASNANLGSQNNDGFRWFKHPEWEKGNASFDVRHRFTASYIYELPFGKGKSVLGGASGAVQQIVGGWQIAGITTASSGNWFTPTDATGFSNSDSFESQMPNVVANPNGRHCQPGTFFNTCAFVDPALGSFGDAGRNSVRGPGFQIWDFSVFKMFQISERTHLEFRTEFFNVANHTNYLLSKSGPQQSNNSTVLNSNGTDLSHGFLNGANPAYGFLTAARAPRQIQFALKLSF